MNPCSPEASVGGLNTPELSCLIAAPEEMKDMFAEENGPLKGY